MSNVADAAAAFIEQNELEYEEAAETFVAMTGQAIVTTYGSYADMHERSLSLTLYKPDGSTEDLGDFVDTLDHPKDHKPAFIAAVKASGAQFGMDLSGEGGEQTPPLPIADFVQVVLDRHLP